MRTRLKGSDTVNKKEIFSIPNILSFVRILLIPLFAWFYLTADDSGGYYLAAVIVIISGITDFLDGQIARRCNMITEFGKFLDPLADKLTQGTLFFCIAFRHPLMWILLVLWLIKDGFMAIMGLILLKTKEKKLDGAKWYGKVCTAMIYFAILALLFFPSVFSPLSPASSILILICAGFMVLSGVFYAATLIRLWIHNESVAKEERKKFREIAKETAGITTELSKNDKNNAAIPKSPKTIDNNN